ncbi:ion transporter [Actinomyces sp. HMSC035G02]|uniref:ion transporter n=1 Tax=Actinomyces sp. HMSC035G02 TaxID=1739406 RepID=UPI0008A8DB33|nr:ion transporter [Actinomyces sp. HMSC035G02]MBS5722560.1 ion transporter [Actinomyces sp.]OHR22832.1 ion transporter [Actinomyces sp. HMSC035G02]
MRKRLYSLLDGDGGAAMWCGRVMTVLIIASLLPLCFKESSPVLETIEYACVLVFIADYLARWATADLKLGKGALSFLIYPFTPMAVIDLLSILPVFNALNDALRTLRVLRLFRALRMFKLIRYSKSASAIAAVFEKEREALLAVLGLAIGYILVSALVIFKVEPETFNTFFDAVYWAVVSLTTVGYGDLYPTSDVGRAIAMISSLMGVAVVALPSGIFTAGMLDELRGEGSASD